MEQGSAKGITPLCAAVVNGHGATVALMIEKGVEFEQAMTDGVYSGMAPLDVAIFLNRDGSHDVMIVLLQQYGTTPKIFASLGADIGNSRPFDEGASAAPQLQPNSQSLLQVFDRLNQRESAAAASVAPQPQANLQSLLHEEYAKQLQWYKALERFDPELKMLELRISLLQEMKRTRDQSEAMRQPVSFDRSGLVSGNNAVSFFGSDSGAAHSQSMPQMQQTRAADNAHLPEQLPVLLPQSLYPVSPLTAVSVFSSPKSPEVPADNSLTKLTSPESSDTAFVVPSDDDIGDFLQGDGLIPPIDNPYPSASSTKRKRNDGDPNERNRTVARVGSGISPLQTPPCIGSPYP